MLQNRTKAHVAKSGNIYGFGGTKARYQAAKLPNAATRLEATQTAICCVAYRCYQQDDIAAITFEVLLAFRIINPLLASSHMLLLATRLSFIIKKKNKYTRFLQLRKRVLAFSPLCGSSNACCSQK